MGFPTHGVHINSGIPNHAFYLLAVALGGSAWQDAGHIWYLTLRRLPSNAQFQAAVNDVAVRMKQAKAAQGVVGLDSGGLFVRYTVWYWLAWVLLLGAFVPLVLEEMWTRKKRPATLPGAD